LCFKIKYNGTIEAKKSKKDNELNSKVHQLISRAKLCIKSTLLN
jgi:hypothetical protein